MENFKNFTLYHYRLIISTTLTIGYKTNFLHKNSTKATNLSILLTQA